MEVMVILLRGKVEEVVQIKNRNDCKHYIMGLCLHRSFHANVCDLELEEVANRITLSPYSDTDYEVHIHPVSEV